MTKNPDLLLDLGSVANSVNSSVSQGANKPKEGFSLFDSIFASLNKPKEPSLPVENTQISQDILQSKNQIQINPLDVLSIQNKQLILDGQADKVDITTLETTNVDKDSLLQNPSKFSNHDVQKEIKPIFHSETGLQKAIKLDTTQNLGSLFDVLEAEIKNQSNSETPIINPLINEDNPKAINPNILTAKSTNLNEVNLSSTKPLPVKFEVANNQDNIVSNVSKNHILNQDLEQIVKLEKIIVDKNTMQELSTNIPKAKPQIEIKTIEQIVSNPNILTAKSTDLIEPKEPLNEFEAVSEPSDSKKQKLEIQPKKRSLFDGLFDLISNESTTSKKSTPKETFIAETTQNAVLQEQTKIQETVAKIENQLQIQPQKQINDFPKETIIQEDAPEIKSTKIEKTGTAANESVLNLIYESVKKTSSNIASLMSQKEAKDIFEAEPTLKNIKKSANILDLDLQTIEKIETKVEENHKAPLKNELNRMDSINFTKAMFVTKEVMQDLNLTKDEVKVVQENLIQNIVTVKIQDNLLNSFESKIIGAKQHMNSLMSEVARTVYENYKPPISAFRIALNPANLGQIAIVLKNNSSSLDIAMSLTNQNTLDVFSENQTALRQQISKAFGENSNINLNFSIHENLSTNTNSGSFGSGSNQDRYFGSSGRQKNENSKDSFEEHIEEQKQSYM